MWCYSRLIGATWCRLVSREVLNRGVGCPWYVDVPVLACASVRHTLVLKQSNHLIFERDTTIRYESILAA